MVRTSADRIAELEPKIQAIKACDERKAASREPETKYLLTALRGINGALKESADESLPGPLDEARGLVSRVLGLLGVQPKTLPVAPVEGGRKRVQVKG